MEFARHSSRKYQESRVPTAVPQPPSPDEVPLPSLSYKEYSPWQRNRLVTSTVQTCVQQATTASEWLNGEGPCQSRLTGAASTNANSAPAGDQVMHAHRTMIPAAVGPGLASGERRGKGASRPSQSVQQPQRPQQRRTPLTAEKVLENHITTVMVAKFPPQCTQDWLVHQLMDDGFRWHVDYVYMPLEDMVTYASKGYAFINLTTPDAAAALVAAWSGRCLVDMGDEAGEDMSAYMMTFLAADCQGLEKHLQKMRCSKLSRLRNPHIRPYVAPFAQWWR
mmetsp:Transcript_4761/g.11503  ORF Transcript_4761/g.11503 Transcript_4761/m.11503 type:complete len:279 (-) Transcript_4761:23-859(-)